MGKWELCIFHGQIQSGAAEQFLASSS
jgi:hypothetical protein